MCRSGSAIISTDGTAADGVPAQKKGAESGIGDARCKPGAPNVVPRMQGSPANPDPVGHWTRCLSLDVQLEAPVALNPNGYRYTRIYIYIMLKYVHKHFANMYINIFSVATFDVASHLLSSASPASSAATMSWKSAL